jgi:DNA-binding transcriptional ArsR family regulator
MVDISHLLVDNMMMLKGLFGNDTAEKALLHIFHYGEAHASAIANDFKMALNPIRQQLNRFENAGILVSKEVGRSRIYSFNPKSPLTKPIKEIVEIAYNAIALSERVKLFQTRRRPRRKGKPIR